MATNTLDELEHLHFEDCVVIIGMNNLLDLGTNIQNLDNDYVCIQKDTLKYYAFKNRLDAENYLVNYFDASVDPRFPISYYRCVFKKLEHVIPTQLLFSPNKPWKIRFSLLSKFSIYQTT